MRYDLAFWERLHKDAKSKEDINYKGGLGKFLDAHLPKEHFFQTQIIRFLVTAEKNGKIKKGSLFWKSGANVYGNLNGVPDILGVIEGRFIALEVKRPFKSKTTQLQKKMIEDLKSSGAVAGIVCFPSDVEALLKNAGLWRGEN